MDAQELRNLQEAYMGVYEEVDTRRAPKELLDRLNSSREGHMAQDGPNRPAYDARQRLLKKAHKRKEQKEQTDLYDIILSHLLDEGYAETPEAAEVIMVNMSEEWRESICEEKMAKSPRNQKKTEEKTKQRTDRRKRIQYYGKDEVGHGTGEHLKPFGN
jgi:hypothetical protein